MLCMNYKWLVSVQCSVVGCSAHILSVWIALFCSYTIIVDDIEYGHFLAPSTAATVTIWNCW